MLRALLAFAMTFQSLTVAHAAPAEADLFFARAETLSSVWSAKIDAIRENPSAELKTKLALVAKPAVSLAHSAQTLMLLWILSGVEAVYQQERLNPLLEQTRSAPELFQAAGENMVNHTELFTSMAGASVAGMTAGVPLKTLAALAATKTASPFLKRLLVGGAASFVTFVGWEFGHRLWQDATLLLDSPEDIRVAKSLRFMDMIRGRGTPNEQRVFTALEHNALNILLFAQPENTRDWIYNTWRLNLATGEFMSVLTAMTVAGVAAGSLAPGAGNVVGFFFGAIGGLVGGGITLLLPNSFKRMLTDDIRASRVAWSLHTLSVNLGNFKALYDARPEEALEELQARKFAQEAVLTVYFEQIYAAYLRIQQDEFILKQIDQRRTTPVATSHCTVANPDGSARLQPLSEDLLKLDRGYFSDLVDARMRVSDYFEKVLELQKAEAEALAPLAFRGRASDYGKVAAAIRQTLQEQTRIQQLLRYIYAGLVPEKAQELGVTGLSEARLRKLPRYAVSFINYFYLKTFKEDFLLGAN